MAEAALRDAQPGVVRLYHVSYDGCRTSKTRDVFSGPQMRSPQPLRALSLLGREMASDSNDAAIEIAKVSKWQDCIETIIASADGSPLSEPKRESGKLIFSGETTSTIKIKHEVFLKHLGEWPPIDMELEAKVRNDLNFIKKEGMGQT